MTLNEAIRNGLVIEAELDVYLTEDGRILKYDRYFKKSRNRGRVCCMWVDEKGNVFRNFTDAYNDLNAYYRAA